MALWSIVTAILVARSMPARFLQPHGCVETNRWLQGHALIRNFESSRGKRRHFCRSCGTHLIAEWSHLDFVILRMGAVDTDPKSLPSMHIWYAQSPAWLRYGEELPHYSQGPKSSLMTPLRVESGPDK